MVAALPERAGHQGGRRCYHHIFRWQGGQEDQRQTSLQRRQTSLQDRPSFGSVAAAASKIIRGRLGGSPQEGTLQGVRKLRPLYKGMYKPQKTLSFGASGTIFVDEVPKKQAKSKKKKKLVSPVGTRTPSGTSPPCWSSTPPTPSSASRSGPAPPTSVPSAVVAS